MDDRTTRVRRAEAQRRRRSLVVETIFTTDTGSIVLTTIWRSPPASAVTTSATDAPHELLRLVEGLDGDVEVAFELSPRPEYGLVKPLVR